MNTQKTQDAVVRKIYHYPYALHDKGVPMTSADFSLFAKPMTNLIYWKSFLNHNNAFSKMNTKKW